MKLNLNIVKTVLTVGAVLGVAGTAYFSAKDGKKICDTCSMVASETENLDTADKIKHYIRRTPILAKPMWKPLVVGGATTVCILASHRISAKQIAALTATCAFLTRNRNYLEDKLKETVGEERLAEIKKEFTKKEYVEKVVYGGPTVEISVLCEENDDPGILCFEGFSGRWFRCPKQAVLDAQNAFRHLFEEDYYCCLNDYYCLLGITMTQFGHLWGFVNDRDYFSDIHFTNTYLTPAEWGDYGPDGRCVNEDVFVLEFDTWPIEGWDEL